MDGRISLHAPKGNRLTQHAKAADLELLRRQSLVFQTVTTLTPRPQA